MIELRTHEGVTCGASRADWELLLDEDPAATVFHGPRYLACWSEVLGQRTRARVHTVHEDGRLVGLIPEGHHVEGSPTGPIEVRRFLGGADVTDYLGPISRPESRADVAAAYIGHLVEDRDWDDVILGGLAVDSGWGDAFERAIGEHDQLTIFERDVEGVCPRVDVTGGYDGYLERLKGKLRHEMTRKARKLARDAGELDVVTVPAGDVAAQIETFLDLAQASQPEKAGFFAKPELRDWFRALAAEFAADGTLRLHQLNVGGMPGAMTLTLVHDGEWSVYNSAWDPALSGLAPGMVLIGQLIQLAAEEGAHTFDLLRGDEAYKYQFGTEDRPVERLTVVRR